MCTLILAWQVFADAPVLAAANRDEALDRPSEPPSVLETDPRVVAPRDAEADGTWIGFNEHGVFVAVTNRWVDGDLAGERSRGLLVRDALRRESAEEAARHVEREVARREYDGFNLVLADADAAVYLEWDGSLAARNFDPGVHVVMNVGADGEVTIPSNGRAAAERQVENGRRVYDALQPEPGEDADAWLDRAASVLGDHEYGVCVHEPAPERRSDDPADASAGGFGTRSASVVRLGADGSASYRFADGPPCETPLEPVALEGQL